MKKKIMFAVLATVVALGSVGAMVYRGNQPLAVHTIQLEKEDYEDTHYEEGTVNPKNQKKIRSSVGGDIVEVLVEEGSIVSQGDVLLKIDKEDLQHQLNILQAQKDSLIGQRKSEGQNYVKGSELKLQETAIELAKEQVVSLEKELQRERILLENGASTKVKVEGLEEAYDKALSQLTIETLKLEALKESSPLGSGRTQYYEGQIEQIGIKIEQVKQQMDNTTVVAPMDGILTNFSVEQGSYVTPHQTLLQIVKPDDYEIEAYVLAKEVKNLGMGMTADIEIDNQNKTETVKGTITYIGPNAIELISSLGLVEKKVKVLIEPEEDVDLILGEKVDVKFITYSRKQAQVLSKDYIFPWEDGEGIWIIDEGKAKIIKINKAFDASSKVVLEAELDEGIEVIVPPYPENIVEGMEVISK